MVAVANYGQFCPIARSSEVLAERWTPIIVRNLINGCRSFSEIRQGAPGIPTALLTKRLESLERHGVLVRYRQGTRRGSLYEPTEMGVALGPVLDAMGQWGARWLETEPRHLSPAYALYATLKLVDVDAIPAGTTVVRFHLSDPPPQDYYMLLRRPRPELCNRPSGHREDLICRTDSRTLVDVHLRKITLAAAAKQQRLAIEGPPRLAEGFETWFRASPFATSSARTR